MSPGPFANRTLCIGTMHGKERVIAPHLEARLGVRCILPPAGFDTDRFGTFSGEVPRAGTALEAARAKATAAMRAAGVDLAVASEGSFGPHPDALLVPVGIELLLLVDPRQGLEIATEHVTTETNQARRQCRDLDDARSFGLRVGFPAHGLLVTLGDPPQRTWRGLRSDQELTAAVAEACHDAERLRLPWFVASDLRASHNPTRRKAIERAAVALADRAATACPACATPGFGRVDAIPGLPCADCGAPTRLTRTYVHGCCRCPVRIPVARPDGRATAEPGDCAFCNP